MSYNADLYANTKTSKYCAWDELQKLFFFSRLRRNSFAYKYNLWSIKWTLKGPLSQEKILMLRFRNYLHQADLMSYKADLFANTKNCILRRGEWNLCHTLLKKCPMDFVFKNPFERGQIYFFSCNYWLCSVNLLGRDIIFLSSQRRMTAKITPFYFDWSISIWNQANYQFH